MTSSFKQDTKIIQQGNQLPNNKKINYIVKNKQKPSPEKVNSPEQTQPIKVQKVIAQKKEELIFVKTIKQLQLFFDKKYLGNKNQSKLHDLKRLSKLPFSSSLNPENLLDLKTGNLNIKVKQIETIFKTQKKNKNKRKNVNADFTDFQLYLAKRDLLTQKNQCIDQIRKLYDEQKRKISQRKINKVKKSDIKEQTPNNASNHPQISRQFQKKNETIQNNKFSIQFDQKTQNTSNIQNVAILNQKNTRIHPKIVKPFKDDYFHKKFEQTIVKNKFTTPPGFSIRALLQPSNRRKTTLNKQQFIKKQLNQIQQIARSTLESFHKKQKVNKILYTQNVQSQSDYMSAFKSKRSTPIDFQVDSACRTERKSINWIIKQCDIFKKQFNIRKSTSLKNIVRYI